MISEAIILAGGLGTRLRSVVADVPKCMAPIGDKPFLYYIIRHYQQLGIRRFIFSLGYKHEMIEQYLASEFPYLNYSCSIESTPLGTGGAILKACSLVNTEQVMVLNGDTFFDIDLAALSDFHSQHSANCTLALKPMKNSDRYGVVNIDGEGRVISFLEKKWYEQSLINGGVYALHAGHFLELPFPEKFSFEKDYLERWCHEIKIFGLVQDGYFIDIGIPEDYKTAQQYFTEKGKVG